jgi:hypothetical protein
MRNLYLLIGLFIISLSSGAQALVTPVIIPLVFPGQTYPFKVIIIGRIGAGNSVSIVSDSIQGHGANLQIRSGNECDSALAKGSSKFLTINYPALNLFITSAKGELKLLFSPLLAEFLQDHLFLGF